MNGQNKGAPLAGAVVLIIAALFGSPAGAQQGNVAASVQEAEMARCAAILAVAAEKFVENTGMQEIAQNFNAEARRFLDEAVITEEQFQASTRRGDVQMRTAFFRANNKTVNLYLQQCLPLLDAANLYPPE